MTKHTVTHVITERRLISNFVKKPVAFCDVESDGDVTRYGITKDGLVVDADARVVLAFTPSTGRIDMQRTTDWEINVAYMDPGVVMDMACVWHHGRENPEIFDRDLIDA